MCAHCTHGKDLMKNKWYFLFDIVSQTNGPKTEIDIP